jgi:hypothetical protein
MPENPYQSPDERSSRPRKPWSPLKDRLVLVACALTISILSVGISTGLFLIGLVPKSPPVIIGLTVVTLALSFFLVLGILFLVDPPVAPPRPRTQLVPGRVRTKVVATTIIALGFTLPLMTLGIRLATTGFPPGWTQTPSMMIGAGLVLGGIAIRNRLKQPSSADSPARPSPRG